MSSYNLLSFTETCPRCGHTGEAEAEFQFGLLELRPYRVGDRVEWGAKGLRFPSARPEGGDFEGAGYVECENCRKDYWVVISVEADIISAVRIDHGRKGYVD
ncbi:hypothetical protein [Nonomuraea sp. NPDC001023]|uniref:hypothetical protein n=1 Tax=unclassified Nonomuraea TaxID=2593643 RepID=UPI00332DF989